MDTTQLGVAATFIIVILKIVFDFISAISRWKNGSSDSTNGNREIKALASTVG